MRTKASEMEVSLRISFLCLAVTKIPKRTATRRKGWFGLMISELRLWSLVQETEMAGVCDGGGSSFIAWWMGRKEVDAFLPSETSSITFWGTPFPSSALLPVRPHLTFYSLLKQCHQLATQHPVHLVYGRYFVILYPWPPKTCGHFFCCLCDTVLCSLGWSLILPCSWGWPWTSGFLPLSPKFGITDMCHHPPPHGHPIMQNTISLFLSVQS